MQIGISVKGLVDVKALLRDLAGHKKDQAMQMAINRTADKAKAELTRAIVEEYAIKADEVRNSVSLARAHKQQAVSVATINLFGSPSKRGRSMNMIHFLASLGGGFGTRGGAKKKEMKQIGARLGFRIKKAGGLKTIKGAFLFNKGRTIFRAAPGGKIEPLQVIGVSQMFNTTKIQSRVKSKIIDDLSQELSSAVAALLRRGK